MKMHLIFMENILKYSPHNNCAHFFGAIRGEISGCRMNHWNKFWPKREQASGLLVGGSNLYEESVFMRKSLCKITLRLL